MATGIVNGLHSGISSGLWRSTFAAAPTFQATGTAVNGSGDITVVWPTHAIGDVGLLFVESANQAAVLGTANGFAAVTSQGIGTAGGAAATYLAIFWCRATTTSMSSPVVTDPGNHATGRIITFRGCVASGTPYEAVAGDTLSPNTPSVSITIPGGTATGNSRLVVAGCSTATDTDSTTEFSGWANPGLTGVTEVGDYVSSIAGGGGFGVACGSLIRGGTIPPTTATLVTSSAHARISLALIPPGVS